MMKLPSLLKGGLGLLFLLVSVSVFAQKDYVLLVNASLNEKSEKDFYDRNIIKMYRAASVNKIPRDQVIILNGNGSNPFKNNGVYQKDTLLKGIAPENQKADGAARPEILKKKFQELAKKMKSGDHLTMYITGHGLYNEKKEAVIGLWGEQITVKELKEMLNLLPKGVIRHITGNFCLSGILMELSSENTCVFTASDAKTVTYSREKYDEYTDFYSDVVFEGRTYYDAQYSAIKLNKLNKTGMNSLDHFLQNNKPAGADYTCEIGGFEELGNSIKESWFALVDDNKGPTKEYFIGFKKNKALIEKTVLEYDSLSASEKEKRRGEFTKLLEEMKDNLEGMKIKFGKEDYLKQNNIEREFIKNASTEQLKKYLSIKACVNYALKK